MMDSATSLRAVTGAVVIAFVFSVGFLIGVRQGMDRNQALDSRERAEAVEEIMLELSSGHEQILETLRESCP